MVQGRENQVDPDGRGHFRFDVEDYLARHGATATDQAASSREPAEETSCSAEDPPDRA
jgi:hypothetical protein